MPTLKLETRREERQHDDGVALVSGRQVAPKAWNVLTLNVVDEAAEAWKILTAQTPQNNLPCAVCFSVSRDIGVFWMKREKSPYEAEEFVQWTFELKDLAAGAEHGCAWCCVIADRFFNKMSTVEVTSNDNKLSETKCECFLFDDERLSKSIKSTIDKLNEMEKGHPGIQFQLIMQPSDYDLNSQSFGKLRILTATTNATKIEIERFGGFLMELTMEVYAYPGWSLLQNHGFESNYVRRCERLLSPSQAGLLESIFGGGFRVDRADYENLPYETQALHETH
jgi:hypothetical protein